MNITDLITGSIGSQAVESISEKLGIDKSQTQYVVSAAIPLMMSALNYNANKGPEGAQGIENAIATKHDGSVFDNLGSLFSQGPTDDDNKIVNHMFGRNTETVKENLAEKSGISMSQISGILAVLAPLVMGYLGKQNKSNQTSGGGIGDLLGSVLGGALGGGSNNQPANSGGGIGDLLGSVLGGALGGGANSQSAQPNIAGGLSDLVGGFFNQDNDKGAKGGILDSLAGMFGK